MKKIFYSLLFVLSLVSISSCDINNEFYCCGDHTNKTEHTSGKSNANLIVNVGDSDYGQSTRAKAITRSVVQDSLVKSVEKLASYELGLYNYGTWYTMTDAANINIHYGCTRGYLFGTTNLTSPYANDWDYNKSITHGTLTLYAKESSEKDYYLPVPVLYWGNYALATNDSYMQSFQETDLGENGCLGENGWSIGEITDNTQSIAISKNIQYATSVFKPIITVADTIIVYSENDGKTTKKISRDNFKFSIRYVYVHSAKSVTYREDFKYTTNGEVAYKYMLKENGIFGKLEGSVDIFDSWENNYTNLTILPTSLTSVQVVLVCYYMGDEPFYIYNGNMGQYTKFFKGGTFYIYGNINSSASNTVTNTGNSLCPKDGSAGVFIPDVRTTATIIIDKLATDTDGKGENDPVVVDPDKETITKTRALFNVDVNYGDMKVDWTIGK